MTHKNIIAANPWAEVARLEAENERLEALARAVEDYESVRTALERRMDTKGRPGPLLRTAIDAWSRVLAALEAVTTTRGGEAR